MPKLTITSPYFHSRVDSNTFTMGNPTVYARIDLNPLQELTWRPSQRLWIWPQDTVHLTHVDRYAPLSLYYGYPARPLPCLDLLQLTAKYGMSRIACMSLVFLLISPERLIGPGGRKKPLDRVKQGVTKRSWLTNSALVYEPKCGGGGAARSQSMRTAIHRRANKLWRSNSMGQSKTGGHKKMSSILADQ